MDRDISVRRVLLSVVLILLAWIDLGLIVSIATSLLAGNEFAALGMPNIAAGQAAIQLLPLMVFLWLTYRVWDALRG
jgi:hypothetical protein